jgi:hypothetical protein
MAMVSSTSPSSTLKNSASSVEITARSRRAGAP